jgi:hypothetical protein
MKAQGATEYLVLLAVVLIVALVSVALLGFFPGMASDAQETQSKAYWQSASPIAIVEWGAKYGQDSGYIDFTAPFLRLRNTGQYPIKITKVIGNNGSASYVGQNWWGSVLMSSIYTLAPGEEASIGPSPYWPPDPGLGSRRILLFGSTNYTYGIFLTQVADSYCSRSAPYGVFVVKSFGFEYTETIEGQTITKRQIGQPLVIKCTQAYN